MADEVITKYKLDISESIASLDKMEATLEDTETTGKKAFSGMGDAADKASKQVDQAAASVDKAARSTRGLQNSINQISRELPAFTLNLNTGFLAISNNLPILADEINNVKKANAELAAQGKQTTSVLGQVVSSLFSWQTAMSVGITLLTVYGAKIIDFIAGSEKSAKAIEEQKKEQQQLNDERDRYLASLDDENKAITKEGESVAARNAARAGGLNDQRRELELLKAKAETSQKTFAQEQAIFAKEQSIRQNELLDLEDRRTELSYDGDFRIKLEEKIKDKQNEIDAANLAFEAKYKNQQLQLEIDRLKREEELLKAQGLSTIDIHTKILTLEEQLYEKGTKERLDKEAELAAFEAANLHKQLEEENKARIEAEQIILEAETKASATRLEIIKTEGEQAKKEYDKRLTIILGNMHAEADAAQANAITNKEKHDANIKQIDADYQTELNAKVHTDQELLALDAEKNRKLRDNDKALNDARLQDAQAVVNDLGSILAGLTNISSIETNNRIKTIEKENDKQKQLIEDRYNNELISKAQHDAQIAELDAKAEARENELRNQQAAKERQLALFLAELKTALAIIEAALDPFNFAKVAGAITAAAELAVLESTPLPKFKDGVIDLSGPGTETSDSILARLSKGESVMTAKSTRQYKDELTAMSQGPINYADLLYAKYVRPEIEKEQSRNAQFVESAMSAMADFNDNNIVKEIREHRKSNSKDMQLLAEVMAKQIRHEKFISKLKRTR